MLNIFIKITFRNLWKNGLSNLINVIGMAIGLCGFILIAIFINFIFSYDSFHADSKQIYRIEQVSKQEVFNSKTPAALSNYLTENVSEITNTTRLKSVSDLLMPPSTEIFNETGMYAETSFFSIFTFPLIKGEPSTVLVNPFSIVLTERLAKKMFAKDNPIGKSIQVGSSQMFTITGIMADLPLNTTFKFSYLLSLPSLKLVDVASAGSWQDNSFYTYIKLQKGSALNSVNSQIGDLIKAFQKDELKANTLFLKPLTEIVIKPSGDNKKMAIIYASGIFGLMLLIIGSVNFIQLLMAYFSSRTKEIAIKKINGSSKIKLVRQLISEAVILSIISVFIAFLFVEILLPFFNEITFQHLSVDYANNIGFILLIFAIAITAGLIAGIYPAVFIVKKPAISLLKGPSLYGNRKNYFKSSLVISQYIISTILIFSTILMTLQLSYIKNKDKGIDAENIMCTGFKITESNIERLHKFEILKEELIKLPGVANVSLSSNAPFVSNEKIDINWEGSKADELCNISLNKVDPNFLSTYNLKIIEGKDFAHLGGAKNVCIINESAAKIFGWKSAIGKKLHNGTLTVIGVVKDFHFTDMNWKIPSLLMVLKDDKISLNNVLSIRLTANQDNEKLDAELINLINEKTNKFISGSKIEYTFLDQLIPYDVTEALKGVFSLLAILAIINSSIGIWGLISFVVIKRTKEIGIRKVNGANSLEIVQSFNSAVLKLLGVALLIALPLSYLIGKGLLNIFVYHISLSWWMFALAGCIALTIALLTVSGLTFSAARRNPIDALRYE